jgi:hypothetical protein
LETTTTKRYDENVLEIEKNIKLLEKKLIKHKTDFKKNPSNWGFVGDVNYINERLKEVVEFLK